MKNTQINIGTCKVQGLFTPTEARYIIQKLAKKGINAYTVRACTVGYGK